MKKSLYVALLVGAIAGQACLIEAKPAHGGGGQGGQNVENNKKGGKRGGKIDKQFKMRVCLKEKGKGKGKKGKPKGQLQKLKTIKLFGVVDKDLLPLCLLRDPVG